MLSARQGEARGSQVWGTPFAGCGRGQADEKGTVPRVSSQRPTCGFVQQTQWQDEPHSLWGTLAGADLSCVGLCIVPRALSLCHAAFRSWRLSDPGSESCSDRPRRVRSHGEAGSAAPQGFAGERGCSLSVQFRRVSAAKDRVTGKRPGLWQASSSSPPVSVSLSLAVAL